MSSAITTRSSFGVGVVTGRKGILASKRVPRPGGESMLRVPPRAPTRSATPTRPGSRRVGAADPVVANLDDDDRFLVAHGDRGGGCVGVARDVGNGFCDRQIRRRLDVSSEPFGVAFEADGDRCSRGQGGEGARESLIRQDRRVDSARELTELAQGPLELAHARGEAGVGVGVEGGGVRAAAGAPFRARAAAVARRRGGRARDGGAPGRLGERSARATRALRSAGPAGRPAAARSRVPGAPPS